MVSWELNGVRGKRIESAANPLIRELARLKERRGRRKSGLYLIEGSREAKRALIAGVPPRRLLLAPELISEPGVASGIAALVGERAEVALLSPAAFSRLSMREKPDGVLLVGEARPSGVNATELPAQGVVLILSGVEKPGNVGALLRSAEAFGVGALLIAEAEGAEGEAGTDLENPNVIRASMGSVFALTTAAASAEEVLSAVRGAGLKLVATSPAAKTPVWGADLTGGVALLLGAEHAGLSEWWLERADETVRIPMRAGLVDSLNVSVAGAVLLYEALRQRSVAAPPPA